jgi:hypothetical protein
MANIFKSQDNRRELYMVVGLVVAWLSYSHSVGLWPYAASTQAAGANTPLDGVGVLGKVPWRDIWHALPILAVGILYYLGRHGGQKDSGAGRSPSGGLLSSAYPWPVFTVQKVTADHPTSDPSITYKNKLRMVLS